MYVHKDYRRQGYSHTVLEYLETWAKNLGYRSARLETGKGQPEAIALYQNSGYAIIENCGPYRSQSNSICLEKLLS